MELTKHDRKVIKAHIKSHRKIKRKMISNSGDKKYFKTNSNDRWPLVINTASREVFYFSCSTGKLFARADIVPIGAIVNTDKTDTNNMISWMWANIRNDMCDNFGFTKNNHTILQAMDHVSKVYELLGHPHIKINNTGILLVLSYTCDILALNYIQETYDNPTDVEYWGIKNIVFNPKLTADALQKLKIELSVNLKP
jgi:hypothetical protein